MSTSIDCLQGSLSSTAHTQHVATTGRDRDWPGIGWISLGAAYVFGMIATFTVAVAG